MAIYTKETGINYDKLIGGTAVAPFTANVTIAGGQNLKRGAVLSANGGKYSQVAKTGTATAILAEDINATTDTVATVYTRGLFNREALIVAGGDTATSHEDQLRAVGIYVTSIKK